MSSKTRKTGVVSHAYNPPPRPADNVTTLLDASGMPRMILHPLVDEAEMCRLLRMSRTTFRRHLEQGPPDASCIDIRLIESVQLAPRHRYWLRKSVHAFLGINTWPYAEIGDSK